MEHIALNEQVCCPCAAHSFLPKASNSKPFANVAKVAAHLKSVENILHLIIGKKVLLRGCTLNLLLCRNTKTEITEGAI